jgi:VWFA-related protein
MDHPKAVIPGKADGHGMRLRARSIALFALLMATSLSAQPPPAQTPPAGQEADRPEQPRFRGGANLVRLDAYVTIEDVAPVDLTIQDFEVLEDNVAQRLESFELIRPRPAGAVTTRLEPNTVEEARRMAADPQARLFVLFMDIWHVQMAGSYRAQKPIITLLDQAIGQDDMVGVMTPEMSARNLTFARRLQTVEGILKNHWFWGERDKSVSSDPREEILRFCYPDQGEWAGIAAELISRRREQKTLSAIEDLIIHLEGIREERKFVILLSEGWLMRRQDPQLARVLRQPGTRTATPPGGPTGIGTDPNGRLQVDVDKGGASWDSCERERNMLAYEDHDNEFMRLLQRANRANVSFYPVDARGLVAFDEPIGPQKPVPITVDADRLRTRQTNLRTLAENTDGFAVLNTNDVTGGVQRIVADTSSYYLLGYYSTNTRLDGKFRRLTVRVKRPNAVVRARPGYLAPTEAELASKRVEALVNGAAPGHSTLPTGFARALERLTPTRGNLPVRVQATAGPAQIWVTTELDAATLKQPEWQSGGRAMIRIEHERGAGPPIEQTIALEPGQRSFSVVPQGVPIAPGRYIVRLQLTPANGAVPIQTTSDVFVPDATALISQTGLALRRGPSTGLQHVQTADARFRRTERLRVEVPRFADEGTVVARVLGRDGQTLPLVVTLGERLDEQTKLRLIVADLQLAPLAQGEYGLEISLEASGKKESTTYAFRVIP